MAERIKERVPTGNTPSGGSLEWRANMLLNLVHLTGTVAALLPIIIPRDS